ncbi:MAG: HPr family phosphocarrier protein [Candidatus Eisenbacteria bacterium]|uniref:HPr family phosphocarrier protein n=1 Tax=Eiseniibacteriota bacterium TaxID=2212470 RepID=A0A7Y2H349_UNCEI|nr:HPr family phosphocarrier protein [Candidatus Eisenbacteria bacterium]
MPIREMEIVNELGMHARAAAEFTKLASKFKASVFIAKDDLEINGKSIMGVLMLAAYCGSFITVRTEGEDADDALDALEKLVENRFGEEK